MKVYILATTFADYDAYEYHVKGVTTSKEFADAWRIHDIFASGGGNYSSDVEELELDVLEAGAQKAIWEFLDPVKNPICECGHRKSHHLGGPKETRCRHNHRHSGENIDSNGVRTKFGPHKCQGFKQVK